MLSAVEKLFVKSGTIVAARKWNGGKLYEIDIHLPKVDFAKWKTAQSIKCRISALHYTDYTPATWDIENKICTLYIDTSHSGQGSLWAAEQRKGNVFHYLKIEMAKHFPFQNKHLVFLGDQTSIGHFCALQQLADDNAMISGIVSFNDLQTADEFVHNCAWLPLEAVANDQTIFRQTENLITRHQSEKEKFVFYIVGGAGLVVQLRKLLKSHGVDGRQIKSYGFWH